jgi:hypothetical protein
VTGKMDRELMEVDGDRENGSRAHGRSGTARTSLGGSQDARVFGMIPFWDIDSTMTLLCFCTVESRVTVDSHGGDLITVTEQCPGGLDSRDPVRDTEWQVS